MNTFDGLLGHEKPWCASSVKWRFQQAASDEAAMPPSHMSKPLGFGNAP
jgi:hypothetical protein